MWSDEPAGPTWYNNTNSYWPGFAKLNSLPSWFPIFTLSKLLPRACSPLPLPPPLVSLPEQHQVHTCCLCHIIIVWESPESKHLVCPLLRPSLEIKLLRLGFSPSAYTPYVTNMVVLQAGRSGDCLGWQSFLMPMDVTLACCCPPSLYRGSVFQQRSTGFIHHSYSFLQYH